VAALANSFHRGSDGIALRRRNGDLSLALALAPVALRRSHEVVPRMACAGER